MKFSRSPGFARTVCEAGSWAVVAILLLFVSPVAGQFFQATEDFSVDPMWDSLNNFSGEQGFGYSTTSNIAGGALGELGGTVIRTPLAFYANDVGTLDPSTTTLTMKGSAEYGGGAGNILVGWFDRFSSTLAWDPLTDFVGFRTDANNYIELMFQGRQVRVSPTNSMGQSIDGSASITSGIPFDYDITYTPTGGARGGGVMMGVFSNVVVSGRTDNTYTATVEPYPSQRDDINDLNRHGLLNLFISGDNHSVVWWLDDMQYTAVSPVGPTEFTWQAGGAGDWNDQNNWNSNASPNSTADTAIFGASISQQSTVFTEQNVTVEEVQFDNANSYGIAGSFDATLNLEANSGNALVNVLSGNHEFQLPITLGSDTNVDVAAGSVLSFQNALNLDGNTFTKTGEGSVFVNNAISTSGGDLVDVQGGTLGGIGIIRGNVTIGPGGTLAPGLSAVAEFPAHSVPEPSVLVLCCVGIVGLTGVSHRRAKILRLVQHTVSWAVLLGFVLATEQGFGQSMLTRTETFDSDPGWDGHNKRSQTPLSQAITQSFGYSPSSSNAGGPAGEIGGTITPAGESAYYGRFIPVDTFDDTFTASGTLNLHGPVHALLGFFNADTVNEWRTPNTVALRLLGRNNNFFFAYNDYGTGLWRAGGNVFPQPGGSEFEFASGPGDVHNWSLTYNPDGNNGGGNVVATIDDETVVTNLSPGHQADGASFDRFGLVTVMKSADSPGQVWLDNVTVNGVTETFSSDPNWDGLNNQNTYLTTNVRPRFDFGFSPTNNAEGVAGGEIGGATFRGDSRLEFGGSRMAYYGDPLAETLNLTQPLEASGKVSFHRGVSDSTTLIGFFHSSGSIRSSDSQASATPENFLGAVIEGPSAEGFYFYPTYGLDEEGVRPSGGIGYPTPPRIYPNGDSHDWTLQYDPTARQGRGQIVVTLDGQAVWLNLDYPHQQQGASFDRFGIVTTHIDGNGQTVYFDDLTYTIGTVSDHVQWAADTSGDATANGNWSPAIHPDSNQLAVLLGDVISQSRVLFTDTNLKMKSLQFDNANSYVFAGQGSVTLEAEAGNASMDVLDGSHQFQVQVNLASDLDVTIPLGSTLIFNHGLDLNGFTLNKLGSGDLLINNFLSLDGGTINGTVINNAATVPEPATVAMLLLALVVLAPVRRMSAQN